MCPFLKRNIKRDTHGQESLDNLLHIPIEIASEIQDLFLEVSSLKEISLQYQAKRRLLEQDGKNSEILESIDIELNLNEKINQIYQRIQSHFKTIIDNDTPFSKQCREYIELRIKSITKELETIQKQQRELQLVGESKKKRNERAYVDTEFCKGNEHAFRYSEKEKRYICTLCGYRLSYS